MTNFGQNTEIVLLCNNFVTQNQTIFSGLKLLANSQLEAKICAKHFIIIYVAPSALAAQWLV
jgi:hypothetical protein